MNELILETEQAPSQGIPPTWLTPVLHSDPSREPEEDAEETHFSLGIV
ncbi:MAG: hypothetical protein ACAH95_04605 [Fimbriimonas sp.]